MPLDPSRESERSTMPPPAGLGDDSRASYVPARRAASESFYETAPTVDPSASWNVTVSGAASPHRPVASGEAPGSRYILERIVGQGGMGEVWLAWQESLSRPVAVKRIRESRMLAHSNEDSRVGLQAEFRHEALVTARLEHPNIAPVYDLGIDPAGNALLAMKFVTGTTWEKSSREDFKAMSAEDFLGKHLPILVDVAQAVAFAHGRGVVHRDLKPSQVMLGEFGEVQLMDWGLAIQIDAPIDTSRPVRPSPGIIHRDVASNPSGTPAMMAPEQTLADASQLGTHTDVYLLGGTLYYLLTGSYPFQANTGQEAFARASVGDFPSVQERAPGRWIPEELATLVSHAMAFKPEDRVPSAKAFLERVQDYLTGASKRRESIRLAEEASAAARAIDPSAYEQLAEPLATVARSLAAWPGNEEAHALEATLRERNASGAQQAGDLRLARFEAQRLAEGPARTALLARIEEAERRQVRQAMQRRVAVAAAFVLLLLMVTGAALFTMRLQEKNSELAVALERAERQQRLAFARSQKSQDLIEFMLGDLGDALDPSNERDEKLIAKVADKIVDFYRGMDLSLDTPETLTVHAEGMLGVAKGLLALGRLNEDETVYLLREGEKIVAGLTGAKSRQTAPFQVLMSELAYQRSDIPTAESAGREALARLQGDLDDHDLAQKATAYNNLAAALYREDRLDEAGESWQKALEIWIQLHGETFGEVATVYGNMATMYMMRQEYEKAEEYLAKGQKVLADLGDTESYEYMATQGTQAALLYQLGRRDEAVDRQLEALATLRKVLGPEHFETARAVSQTLIMMREVDRIKEGAALSLEEMDRVPRIFAEVPEEKMRFLDVAVDLMLQDGNYAEGEKLAIAFDEASKSLAPDSVGRGKAIRNLAIAAAGMRRFDEAANRLGELLEFCRGTAGGTRILSDRWSTIVTAFDSDEGFVHAEDELKECLEMAEAEGLRSAEQLAMRIVTAQLLGRIARKRGDMRGNEEYFGRAIQACREGEAYWIETNNEGNVAAIREWADELQHEMETGEEKKTED